MQIYKETLRQGATACAVLLLVLAVPAGSSVTPPGSLRVRVLPSSAEIPAGKPQTAYIKVELTGMPAPEDEGRAPLNIALVVDRSGSMSGEKIRRAKAAARMAVQRLKANDIVSLVAYSQDVQVLLPATKASDKAAILAAIGRLEAQGSTALYGGVQQGAAEVRKFHASDRVNRVVLFSDGLANQGPSSPEELAALGYNLREESITVSTIGIGRDYDEDLMGRLAEATGANHHFAEDEHMLAKILDLEIDDAATVVAQNISVRIDCAEGVRPVRILGREGKIDGQTAHVPVAQVYGDFVQYVLLEVELPAGEAGQRLNLAEAHVSYRDTVHRMDAGACQNIAIAFSAADDAADTTMNKNTMASVARQLGAERNEAAMKLRDAGKVEEAQERFVDNVSALNEWAEKTDSEWLRSDAAKNADDAANLSPGRYQAQRKRMIRGQKEVKGQYKYIKGGSNNVSGTAHLQPPGS